jgi:hypothetical protein
VQDSENATNKENDVVWNAGPIGEVIGKNERATYWLLENGRLPAKKVGRNWVASRKKLLAHLSTGEAT